MYEYCNDIFGIASALNKPLGMRTPMRYGLNTITEFSMAFLVQMYIYVEFRPTTISMRLAAVFVLGFSSPTPQHSTCTLPSPDHIHRYRFLSTGYIQLYPPIILCYYSKASTIRQMVVQLDSSTRSRDIHMLMWPTRATRHKVYHCLNRPASGLASTYYPVFYLS